MNLATILGCIIITNSYLQAQNFHLVKDVNDSKDGSPLNNGFPISYDHNFPFALLKNVAYFTANDGIHGNEVWRSDGTPAGTYLVKDINGIAGSSNPSQLVTSGKFVYFKGTDSSHGTELWRTNGTAAGTMLVRDITTEPGDPRLNYLTDVNGTLFFAGYTDADGNELMKSDGTTAGTVVVKDVTPGTAYSSVSYITNAGGKAFYYYSSGVDSLEGVYASDGTPGGTIRLTQTMPFISYNSSTAVGNKYFFAGPDGEPWISNGTLKGTHLIKAINPLNGSFPFNFTAVNGVAYFSATDQTHGQELWRSDGTKAGTYLVKDITPGSNSSSLYSFTAAGNVLFFLVTNASGNIELWKSDGTDPGTTLVKSFGSSLAPVMSLAGINGLLYFQAYTTTKGYEIWRSDGTTAGTVMLKDIYGGNYSSFPSGFTPLFDKILFSANDGVNGTELWLYDSLTSKASLLKDINNTSTSDGASFWSITPFKDQIYFRAYTPQNGTELWATDGTAGKTRRVTDIEPGSLDGLKTTISQFFTSSNRLYFEATNLKYGDELWLTDGDSSAIVKDITTGRNGTTFPEQWLPGNKKTFNNIDSTVFFITGNNQELWQTTGKGAVSLKQGNGLSGLTRNKKDMYFAINSGELWKTDGSVVNTVKMNNAHLPNSYGIIPSIISYKGKVYYASYDHTMWLTDGTDNGTVFFKNINPQFDAPVNFASATNAVLNNTLFFAANDGVSGLELWKTDGTANGTVMVKDINAGPGACFTDEFRTGYFTQVDSVFYFIADDNVHGYELWKSNGTPNGTIMVADITPGSAPSLISSLTQAGGKLAFLVYDNTLQKDVLWQSDGTTEGTQPVSDANLADVTLINIFNNGLVGYKDKLYFTAYTPLYGYELWTGSLPSFSAGAAVNNAVQAQLNKPGNITVQPNPVVSGFILQLNDISKDQQVQVQISSSNGVIMFGEKKNVGPGKNQLHYDASSWAPGMYAVRIAMADGSIKETKIIKQ